MVLVKILGMIDLIAAVLFLMLIFGIQQFYLAILFVSILLLIKGLFIFTGEIPLSMIDILSAIILFASIFLDIFPLLLWIPAFLLLAKGFMSFI
ncbi:hypothetical protein J4408_01925 [Candidatus Pacearchaeota archaeon]|nr:MAG: hypothetical protein UW10_C0007G0015 [Candidatus Magasanikbacteria bacterium GW2011_GWA2_43_9]MBS3071728.1 hypothetical protein [Candidatus Pacearchaeota archaeon]